MNPISDTALEVLLKIVNEEYDARLESKVVRYELDAIVHGEPVKFYLKATDFNFWLVKPDGTLTFTMAAPFR